METIKNYSKSLPKRPVVGDILVPRFAMKGVIGDLISARSTFQTTNYKLRYPILEENGKDEVEDDDDYVSNLIESD